MSLLVKPLNDCLDFNSIQFFYVSMLVLQYSLGLLLSLDVVVVVVGNSSSSSSSSIFHILI